MATLYLSEYSSASYGSGGSALGIGQEPANADQTVAISGSSAQSAAFGAKTYFLRVHTDAICSVAFGASPTATTSNKRLAANQTEYWGVWPGGKIAVISNS